MFICAASAVFCQTNPDWKTLDQPTYSLQYPFDWQLDQSGQMETELLLLSPKSNATDDFQENINLVSQSIAEYGLDLDGYVQHCFGQLRQLLTNFQVISMDKLKSGTDVYYKLVYRADQGAFHLQLEQHYFVKNNQAYVLTFTCETEALEGFKAVSEKILTSFALK